MFYFKGLMDCNNKHINNKIKTSSRFSVLLPIFVIYNNIKKEKDDGNETK